MPYLLVATDFSENSNNACRYACNLALATELDIMLLHCYSFPIAFTDLPVPTPYNEAMQAATEGMEHLLNKLVADFPQIKFSTRIVYGDVIDAISEFADGNEAPVMAVAGNSHNDDNPAWMDSTILKAFRNVKFPVLAIPPDTVYKQVRKIGFAYDNKYQGSDLALIKLRELVRLLGAELHIFFAASETKEPHDLNEQAKIILMDLGLLFHVYDNKDVETTLVESALKYDLDWMALMPRHHNFLETLFHKSQTRIMINDNFIPLLSLHENM